jgi:quercetin dioxygenase-like cupin family protein
MRKTPILIESLKDNNGKRSISKAVFPPGAKCFRHHHTQWEETFEVIEGEFTVYIGKAMHILTAGKSSPKIRTGEAHYFKNLSKQNVIANVISEPGHVGCENATKILSGLEADGRLDLLGKFKGYNSLWIVLYDMTNTLLTGLPKLIFSILRVVHGKDAIQREEQDLLDSYCNNTMIHDSPGITSPSPDPSRSSQ